MNKQYLKENGLYDAHKQFMRLCEWSYSPSALEEEGDEQQDPNAAGGNPMGGADPSMGGDPSMGADPNAMGNNADPSMGADPNTMGADPNMAGGDPSMGADPNAQDPNAMGDDMGMQDPMMGGDPMMDDPTAMDDTEQDDVIDVEDLTQAQEKVNDKVNHIGKDLGSVDTRIDKLMVALDKMETMINNNNAKIEDLNKQVQDRVPLPVEKLNLRALDSYPFNVKPTAYWEKKINNGNPNYAITADNSKPPQEEYTIKQSDIDNLNTKDIEDSFDSFIDDDMRQSINRIFDL